MTEEIIPKLGVRPTPKERFFERLEKNLREGLVVGIGEYQFRYCQEGQTFEEGDEELQALDTGIYVRCPRTQGGKPIGYSWLWMGYIDHLERIAAPHLEALTPTERELVFIGMVSQAALRGIRKARPTKD